jgi:hypothetical protein
MFAALGAPFALRALQDERLAVLAVLSRLVAFEASCTTAVGALEPHVPWTLPFLTLRRDCYAATGDARVAVAARDLRTLIAHEPASLKAGFD